MVGSQAAVRTLADLVNVVYYGIRSCSNPSNDSFQKEFKASLIDTKYDTFSTLVLGFGAINPVAGIAFFIAPFFTAALVVYMDRPVTPKFITFKVLSIPTTLLIKGIKKLTIKLGFNSRIPPLLEETWKSAELYMQ